MNAYEKSYEIERKFLVPALPKDLEKYPCSEIEQGYLCTEPVVRIRKSDDAYTLTYKGTGLMVREEYNLPLTREAYAHLREKTDGRLIIKKRYKIPYGEYMIELDVFTSPTPGLWLAEVEFSSRKAALAFQKPDWFGEDVTQDPHYHNSNMSRG